MLWPIRDSARAAGYALEQVDGFLDKLGKPIGVKSYKHYHSTGEDFLHNYLGMCGIPMDLVPEFPADANTIFLAESAKFDNTIVDKIKRQLAVGKTVVITSGLLKALQGKGIEDIVELEYTDKKAVFNEFMLGRRLGYQTKSDIVIPQIKYLANDSWEEISCLASGIGYPILHSADYTNSKLYVLTIPDNFGDLYNFPAEVLTRIKELLTQDLYVAWIAKTTSFCSSTTTIPLSWSPFCRTALTSELSPISESPASVTYSPANCSLDKCSRNTEGGARRQILAGFLTIRR